MQLTISFACFIYLVFVSCWGTNISADVGISDSFNVVKDIWLICVGGLTSNQNVVNVYFYYLFHSIHVKENCSGYFFK